MIMLELENSLWNAGYEKIACMDEVGRGCLFGSVLAAAVILPKGLYIEGVRDSKKLSAKKREVLYEAIKEQAIAIGVGTVSAKIIDEINIKNATRLAMKKAIKSLKDSEGNIVVPEYLLIDAESIDIEIPQTAIIKGDDTSHGIAAASIVAKVIRDRMCLKWAEEYPNYGIDQHKGYGTKLHREALLNHGPSQLHRKTFIKKIMG
ncbi:ribonuclease HII [Alkaliphilus peptidifermentans]|uniref:Ribonuclease HII n=1 Tax=Alkaliphilus peptidifermentans DSM 18978 TaxID=1120976 RepID=A0A1G5J8C9_9FIRM|nr:ribonuclease HII [Alkaliphilus peptidifermentans]SCY84623.1 RNase HII [Alkaliphilus peptidifermentans DSM 18978]